MEKREMGLFFRTENLLFSENYVDTSSLCRSSKFGTLVNMYTIYIYWTLILGNRKFTKIGCKDCMRKLLLLNA